jgi:uncharacterized membrane protein
LISKSAWLLRRLARKIWARAAMLGLLGVLTALAGTVFGPMVPVRLDDEIGADAVDTILGILASSMLAVITFSLSVAVQAFAAASSAATPRASRLLEEDSTTQNVLSVFVGAFLFSLVGIIALSAGIYGGRGRVILFVSTLFVVMLVVVALLRWIDHIMRFGRVADTMERVEKAAAKALEARAAAPYLGGRAAVGSPPAGAHAVAAPCIGYIRHIDIEALAACAEAQGASIWLATVPGAFVTPAGPLLHITGGAPGPALVDTLCDCFEVADTRNYDQDPRFGVIVMAEIASRALSPAVNDAGTAIDAIGRLVRLLAAWQPDHDCPPQYPRITVPGLESADLVEDAFVAIARDGATMIEVQIRLQKALATLASLAPQEFAEPCRTLAAEAARRAKTALADAADVKRLASAIATLR